MKKLVLALTAIAAFTGGAQAADMAAAPRTYTKAPVVEVAPSWTGLYIFGGAGGGIWDASTGASSTTTGACIFCTSNKQGGDGWYGTVGAGYDYQMGKWVGGILADGQFGSIKGSIGNALGIVGTEKVKDTWAVGARIGYLIAPNVLSYVNAGYTGSDWSGVNYLLATVPTPAGVHSNSFSANGWFIGGGVENNLDILGFAPAGWFMKTEYRAAYYGNKNLDILANGTNTPTGFTVNFNSALVQTVSTSLVYRFNWNGPVVAKY